MSSEQPGYHMPPHCLDDVFEGGGNARQMERAFRMDSEVDAAFQKASRAYLRQVEFLKDPKFMGPSPAQAARDVFMDALDCEVKTI